MITNYFIAPGLPHVLKMLPNTYLRSVIISNVSKETGIEERFILSHNREYNIMRARTMCVILLREHTTLSLVNIANFLGYSDHTSVVSATQRARRFEMIDPIFNKILHRIKNRL